MDKITMRHLKFDYAPYLLTIEEYYNYIEVWRLNAKAWDIRLIPLSLLICFGVWAVLGFTSGRLMILVIAFVLTLQVFTGLISKSKNILWLFLFFVSVIITILFLYLTIVNNTAFVILLYFAISHLIMIIRTKKLFNSF